MYLSCSAFSEDPYSDTHKRAKVGVEHVTHELDRRFNRNSGLRSSPASSLQIKLLRGIFFLSLIVFGACLRIIRARSSRSSLKQLSPARQMPRREIVMLSKRFRALIVLTFLSASVAASIHERRLSARADSVVRPGTTPSYMLFESGQVRPLALSPDGTQLF